MSMTDMLLGLAGGVLIGLASALLLAFSGRIAGISGIVEGVVLPKRNDTAWRAAFVAGMVGVGAVLALIEPGLFPDELPRSSWAIVLAGLLVGFGTRMGSGCTSGHGVCGVSRFSPRSMLATVLFMAFGIATVTIITLFFGGTV